MAIRTKLLLSALLLGLATVLPAPHVQAEDKPPTAKVKDAFPDETRAVLEQPDELEVLALVCERPPKTGEDVFRGYPVKKRVTVPKEERAALIAALYQGIEDGGPVAKCFEPHHGLHAKQGDKTVDLVICFVCLQTQVHDGGRRRTVATTKAPESALGKLLGETVKPEAKAETKLYEGKSVREWSDLIVAAKVRRHGGKLPDELAPALRALAKAMKDDPDSLT
ncbi:MAG: hypothetical protein ACAI25_09595, partial [Planctomycetota bacterium]